MHICLTELYMFSILIENIIFYKFYLISVLSNRLMIKK
jgi:hypothetical protein